MISEFHKIPRSILFEFFLLGSLISQIISPLEVRAFKQVGQPNSEMFLSWQTSQNVNPESYRVNGYQVQVEYARNSEIAPPCLIFSLSDENFGELLPPCALVNLPPHAILPASVGTSPREYYDNRKQYLAWSYAPQELVLIAGLIHSSNSVKVVKIQREEKQWIVTIDLNESTLSSTGVMSGTIVKVDLGYLISNDYQVIINWNFKEDGILTRTFTDTLNFRVFVDESVQK